MRIWDIDAGFLHSQSLLGEHRELHGIHSIITNNKTGYSRHPETLRWVYHLSALEMRHGLLVAEMKLRGFNHYSPLQENGGECQWPSIFLDKPAEQYKLLQGKYTDQKQGRIPLPRNIQELWASHKYSVMAHAPSVAKKIGQQVATLTISSTDLSKTLVQLLRIQPSFGQLENAILHMWGYVSQHSALNQKTAGLSQLLAEIQAQSRRYAVSYLLCSTALSELKFWCDRLIKK